MRLLLAGLVVAVALTPTRAQQPRQQTFTGVINDDACAGFGHNNMRMDPNDAECARLCVLTHGSPWVLEVGAKVYLLSDQMKPREFATRRVNVTGTLDEKTNTIRVVSISAAR